jgi:hypothetical protein
MTHDSHGAKTATIKNLFDRSLAGETKRRILELHPHSQRLWGKMTVAQTLAHCTFGLEMAMGVINPRRAPLPAYVMGLLIKPLAFGNDKPMRRNSPSSPELFSADHIKCDFERERGYLIATIDSQRGTGEHSSAHSSVKAPISSDQERIVFTLCLTSTNKSRRTLHLSA